MVRCKFLDVHLAIIILLYGLLMSSISLWTELLWLLFRIANSNLLYEMGHRSWEENYGSNPISC